MRDRKHGNDGRTIWFVSVCWLRPLGSPCVRISRVFLWSPLNSYVEGTFGSSSIVEKLFFDKVLRLRYVPAMKIFYFPLFSMSKLYQDVLCPFSGLNFHRQSRLTETGIRTEIDFCRKCLLCHAFMDTTYKTLMVQRSHDDTLNLKHFNAATQNSYKF